MTLDEQFQEFHAVNPHVYEEIERLALEQYHARPGRIGIRMIWETMRFNQRLRTLSQDEYKLNNNFAPRYARMLIANHPELEDFVEVRERQRRVAA